jgi:hypothetical protein
MSSYISLENKSDIEVVASTLTSLLANQAGMYRNLNLYGINWNDYYIYNISYCQLELTSIPLNTKSGLVSSLLTDLDENGVQQKWTDNGTFKFI